MTTRKRKKIKIFPIGFAKNKVGKNQIGGFQNLISEIILEKKYAPGLEGLGKYSHIVVLYWMSQAEGIVHLKHRPQGNPQVPTMGIFATRCQWRPNCIGISTVPLLGIKENVVKVKGLDVLDGTPILDLKPYLPDYDQPKGRVKLPSWTKKLTYL